jgi:excisionase family DNA binding protein
MEQSNIILNVADAAEFLRVSESIVRRLIRERRIPFFQIDGRYLFYRPAVEEWITQILVKPDGRSLRDEAKDVAAEIWQRKDGN